MRYFAIILLFTSSLFAINTSITSFNAGQVTPLLEARSDFNKYNSACRILENMLVATQGPVHRRPGTQYIATAADGNNAVKLISFEYAHDDTYILELGHQYMRFYRSGGLIMDANDSNIPYKITTKFTSSDVFNIQYAQADNAMYLVDGNHPPQILQRHAHDYWTIGDCNFTTGPFMPMNIEDITITPSGTTGTITLIADSNIWNASHVGSLWEINQQRGTSVLKGTLNAEDACSPNSASFTGGYSFTTSGTWDATVTLERSTDSGSTWTAALAPLNAANFNNPSETETDGAIYRVRMSDYVSGTCTYIFTITDQLNHGIVKIATFVDANEVTATVITSLVNTNGTKQWREGYWSAYRKYPRTVEFHQQRLVFGGSTSFPQTIWFGKSDPDNYLNFTEGTLDTDPFTVALPGQNPIQWLLSQDYLFIGTLGSTGKYGEQGKAITPTSPNYQEQSKAGSARLQAQMAGDVILYVERGERKIREFAYSLEADKYLSPDLTMLAENITISGIKDIAFQSRPQPRLWCVLNDGNMATLTYQRDQEVVGWSKQTTTGNFESVAVIPNGDEDEVWISASRTIDTNTARYIERFKPVDFGNDINNVWFVDSGLSYSGSSTATLTDANHLRGCTVAVLGDGLVHSNKVVEANGTIRLSKAVSNAVIGLPFTSRLETMPILLDQIGQSTSPAVKRIQTVDFDLYKTGVLRYGNGQYSTLTTVNFANDYGADPNATVQPLFTSETASKRCSWLYGTKTRQTVYVDVNNPMPLTIRAITPNVEIMSR